MTPEEKLEAINEVLPGCQVIHQGYPVGYSCLDTIAWAKQHPENFNLETYLASCEEHMCLHCKILRILEAK